MLPRHVVRLLLIGIESGLSGFSLLRAEEVAAVPAVHYLDEESGRMVTIRETQPPAVTVEIRFPSDPGYPFVWLGKGTREDNRIVFSRVVGEEEPPDPASRPKPDPGSKSPSHRTNSRRSTRVFSANTAAFPRTNGSPSR